MDRALQPRIFEMELVEQAVPGPDGWAPSSAQLEAGQTAFASRVVDGRWWGHEVLVPVYKPVQGTWWQRLLRRLTGTPEPQARLQDLGFTAE